jgi:phenylpyruvate tautomerase PptA (4-oxalocrotonate tautomerase family)
VPLLDVDLPAGLIPEAAQAQLLDDLGKALLRAEGLPTEGPILAHASVFLNILAPGAVRTLAGPGAPAPVRVRVTTAAGSLDRGAQRQVVADITRLVAQAAGDESVAARTLVLHSEIAEGGWGTGGVALGREDFDALNAKLH